MAIQRGLRGQLDLLSWAPPTSADRRAAVLAAIGTASAAQVGRRLGMSRDAVLGHVHRARRAGLAVPVLRPERVVPEPPPARPPIPAPTVRPPVVGTPMPSVRPDLMPVVVVASPPGPPTLLTIGARQCRAIVQGDDQCCGAPVEERGSWCAAHRLLFHSPAKLRPVTLPQECM